MIVFMVVNEDKIQPPLLAEQCQAGPGDASSDYDKIDVPRRAQINIFGP